MLFVSNVYWTVHHCNSWRMKDQLDVTCCFISLIMRSTCFGHYYIHLQELATVLMNYHIGRLVLSSLCVGAFVAAGFWWCSFCRLKPATCWAHNQWNKIASDIKLVFHSSTIPILFELDPFHTPTSHFLKINLNIILPFTPGIPSGFFPSGINSIRSSLLSTICFGHMHWTLSGEIRIQKEKLFRWVWSICLTEMCSG